MRCVLSCPSTWAHDMKLLRDSVWVVNVNLALYVVGLCLSHASRARNSSLLIRAEAKVWYWRASCPMITIVLKVFVFRPTFCVCFLYTANLQPSRYSDTCVLWCNICRFIKEPTASGFCLVVLWFVLISDRDHLSLQANFRIIHLPNHYHTLK